MRLQRKLPRTSKIACLHKIHSHLSNTQVFCESRLEFHTALTMEFYKGIKRYISQPFSVDYLFGKQKRRYTPDFLLELNNSTFLCIEVKPLSEFQKPKNKAKFAVLKAHFRDELYHPLKLISDADIYQGKRVSNYELLYPYLQQELSQAERQVALGLAEPIVFEALYRVCAQVSDMPTQCAYRLIAHGLFDWNINQPLHDATVLKPRGC